MSFSPEILLHYYERMHLIRFFEQKLGDLFAQGLLGGTSHFCIGQEACAVGVLGAARDDDWVVSNHRGHGHLLARGLDPDRVMGELLGRLNGYCRGRGGSQHLCSMEDYFLGTNGITGGGIPIGTGAALALKYRREDRVVIVFFGDGASNQGTFHESLNMASLWKLPVLYVCENNGYGMSTSIQKACASDNIATRAAAYNIPANCADGMQITEVVKASNQALRQIRAAGGPFLLELQTYRFCGHSKNEPRVYRSREEETRMQERDCLLNCEKELKQRGVPLETIRLAEERARQRIDEAAQKALQAPVGGPEEALGAVYA